MADLVAANRALTNHVEELTTRCDSLVVITSELGCQNSLLRGKMHQLNAQLAEKDDQLADQGEELGERRAEVGRLQGLVAELEGEVRGGEGGDCWLCLCNLSRLWCAAGEPCPPSARSCRLPSCFRERWSAGERSTSLCWQLWQTRSR